MTFLGSLQSLAKSVQTFVRDRRGASAIEFAFVIPIMLIMYLGTMELGQGIETNKKVARSASMIADLVTQEQTLTKSEIDGILVVGESILQPYYRSRPKITITAIRLDSATPPEGKVVWRRQIENGLTSGDTPASETISVPAQLRTPNSFLIRVETELAYLPVITWTAGDNNWGQIFSQINMREGYNLRPRQSAEVTCSDC